MNIKYEEQVHLLERIPLGAPLQDCSDTIT